MAHFVAYYRVSTSRQGQSGLGLEAQENAVQSYLHTHGGALLTSFTEIETGKGNQPLTKRPELAAALDMCQKKRATLLIASLDRLARNVHFISGLMESKVDFVAADMPNASRFELHIRAAVAEEERRKISERTKSALAAAKARGVALGAHGRILAAQNKKAADLFAESMHPTIEALRNEGFTTLLSLVDALNDRDIPTARGGRWHLRTVERLVNRQSHLKF